MTSINTNIDSITTSNHLYFINNFLAQSIEKLGTGLQVRRASDDPSGLAIADNLRHHSKALNQSIGNANSALALIQIADRAMSEQSSILDMIKQKLIQGSSDTTSDEGRKILSKSISRFLEQFDQIAKQTRFQDQYLLQKSESDTSKTTKIAFILGQNYEFRAEARDGIQANTQGLAISESLSLSKLKDISNSEQFLTKDNMNEFLSTIDTALSELNNFRSDYGSVANQVGSSYKNLLTQHTNTTSAESVIRDVDYAKESADFKKFLLTYDAGSFALTQANISRNYILGLLV